MQYKINREITQLYLTLDPKARFTFDSVVEANFSYRNYFYLFVVASFVITFIAYRKQAPQGLIIFALLVCITSFFTNWYPLWHWMV